MSGRGGDETKTYLSGQLSRAEEEHPSIPRFFAIKGIGGS
jgi:hypothetical protein